MYAEYITVQEAAKRWNISSRMVTNYLAAGRIDGALRNSYGWLIPVDAQRPSDRRFADVRSDYAPEQSGSPKPKDSLLYALSGSQEKTSLVSLRCPFLLFSLRYEPGHLNELVARVSDSILQCQLMGEIHLMRCEYSKGMECCNRVISSGREDLSICGWYLAACLSVYLNDVKHFVKARAAIRNIRDSRLALGDVVGVKVAELADSMISGYCVVDPTFCDWIRARDFTALPGECSMVAVYNYCQYLRKTGKAEQAIGAVDATVPFMQEHPVAMSYHMLQGSAALTQLGYSKEGDKYVEKACKAALADGLLLPLAVFIYFTSGRIEYISESIMAGSGKMLRRISHMDFNQWMCILEKSEGRKAENPLNQLTCREYQIARLARFGMSNMEIAGRLDISYNTVKFCLQVVFEKLNITSRFQLQQHIK